ncbi:hypothetical protein LSTR_LSTR007777 [Laodelphax striatellus]|uniref:Uncharacterized protein n=1 Tax=Laodelphax striatellus TaxID=195883 RepID=A0A482XSN8_LAOST|nr:hypothetical protein LSTR_LSTR007777 [Laodelphax striatellus]
MTGYFGDEFPSLTDEESIADGLDPTWEEMETNIAPLSIFDPRIMNDNQEMTINNESSTVKSTEQSTDETSAEGDLVSTSEIENNNESSTKKVMIGAVDGSPSSQSTEEVINDLYPELFNSRGKMEPNLDPLSRKVMEISEDQDMIRPISKDYKSLLVPKIENIDYESITSKKGNNDDDDFETSTMSYTNDNNYETSTNVVNHNYDQESSTNRRFNYYSYYDSSTDEVNHKYDHESSTKRRFNYYSYYETSTNGANHDNDLESSTEIFTSDNGSTSMESSDDDDSSVGDMDVDSSITGFITHFSLAIQKVIVYYYIMVGTLFGIATIFHAILLVGVHYDYTTPILIWLIEQGVLLVLDVSYLITMVFYSANSYAIFGYSLIFGFSLYCLLIVKSYHKTLKKLEKLKSIDAV